MQLTDRVTQRIQADFPGPGDAAEVAKLVLEASDTERVQAGIVLVAGGRLDALVDAVELARLGWRDLLVAAGLANADWPDQLDARLGPSS